MKLDKNTGGRLESELYDTVVKLENQSEARSFLRDLLTPEEIYEFSLRWKVARMLKAKYPYSYITSQTGMSTTTIARVSKWLNGRGGGYRTMIARLHHTSTQSRMTPDS